MDRSFHSNGADVQANSLTKKRSLRPEQHVQLLENRVRRLLSACRDPKTIREQRRWDQLGDLAHRLTCLSQELDRLACVMSPTQTDLSKCHASIQMWVGRQIQAWESSRMPLERWMSGQRAFSEVTRTSS